MVVQQAQFVKLLTPALMVALLAGCIGQDAPPAEYANGGSGLAGSDQPQAVASSSAKCFEGSDEDDLAQQVLTLINIERARAGVAPLSWDPTLAGIAEDFACTMAAYDFFDHVNPINGEGPAERAIEGGYEFFGIGENLAGGQTTAAAAVEGWLDSPGHRDNLLSTEWRETGIGVRRGGSLRIYWVQEFGKPARRPTAGTSLTSATPS
ncbi:MAG: CAP domain-containing protein [Planctomycetes bacterium]|nr:CAP domain-containing protein [Planctomycetota bacterium]